MTINVDPNAAHAVYSPSSAHRWMNCTASAEAIATLPPQEEGEAAAAGTKLHDELERALKSGETTHEDFGIALMLNYVRQLIPGQLFIEERVALTEQIWGRMDVGHFANGVLTIADLKTGFVGVDAEENEQLRIYGAAAIYTHRLPAKWIRYAIVQPNDFRPVPHVKQWMESADSLFAFASKAAAVPVGPKTFTAGEHCRYCPLFGKCEPTRDLLARLSIVLQYSPADVQPDQVALFKGLRKPIEDWFKALDKAKTPEALSGTHFPGLKVVRTIGNRAWKDEQTAREQVIKQLGYDALKLPTPSQAEGMGMDVSQWCERPEGKPELAFESDRRPVFERRSGVEMFGNVNVQRTN